MREARVEVAGQLLQHEHRRFAMRCSCVCLNTNVTVGSALATAV